MAQNTGVENIFIEGSIERRVRIVVNDFSGCEEKFIHIPMELEWPSGDPVPRDKETLVIRYTQKDAERYGIS